MDDNDRYSEYNQKAEICDDIYNYFQIYIKKNEFQKYDDKIELNF